MAKETPQPETLTAEAVILRSLHGVMQEVGYIQKTGENDFHGYTYATEADVLERIRPSMIKHGLLLIPSVNQVSSIDQYGNTSVTVQYTLGHVSGAVWPTPIVAAGCGNDKNKNGTGDKGLYKALTGANKYLLFKLFQIETGNDPEDNQADLDREAATKAATQFYAEGAMIAISKAETVADLKDWWESEKNNRQTANVTKGTNAYSDIYGAFLARGKELAAKEKGNG